MKFSSRISIGKNLLVAAVLFGQQIVFTGSAVGQAILPEFSRDLIAESPARRYRLTRKAEVVEKSGKPVLQQTMILVDTLKRDQKWLKKLSVDARTNHQWAVSKVFVSNSGNTVVLSHGGALTALSRDGTVILYRPDFLVSPRKSLRESSKAVHHSWLNPFDICFFLNDEAGESFIYRGWPFGAIMLSMSTGKMTAEWNQSASEEIEINRILDCEISSSRDSGTKKLTSEGKSAIYWAGLLRMQGAKKRLTELSHLQVKELDLTESTTRSVEPSETTINKFDQDRFLVISSIRRFSVSPERSTVVPISLSRDRANNWVREAKSFRERRIGSKRIKIGDSIDRVVSLMGCPDYLSIDDYFYEIAEEEATTVFLDFSSGKVFAVHHLSPPVCQSSFFDEAIYSGNEDLLGQYISKSSVKNSLHVLGIEKAKESE